MKLAKYLFIGLVFVPASWLVGMEPDDGGVTESKSISSSSTSTKADGLASDELLDTNYDYANYLKIIKEGEYAGMLVIAYNGDIITVPKEIWSEFEVLESRFQSDFGFKKEFEIEDLNYLYELFKAIQPTTDLKLYPVSDLINLIYYADSLLIKNWKLLDSVSRYIKQTVRPDQLVGLVLPEINGPVLNNHLFFNYLFFNDAQKVLWSPDANSYLVLFHNGKVQRYDLANKAVGNVVGEPADHYDLAGRSVGDLLKSAISIAWAPDGQSYLVGFYIYKVGFDRLHWGKYLESPVNGGLQLYNLSGRAIGPILSNVKKIDWAPDGRSYFALFSNWTAQRYNLIGEALGSLLENVKYVNWAPDGRNYFIEFQGGTAQRYNLIGEALGSLLENVLYVSWAPDGRSYFVKFYDQKLQLYNALGKAIGGALNDGSDIIWAPDGQSYFVKFYDQKFQLYDAFGRAIGSALNREDDIIIWAPDGQSYLVKGLYKGQLQLYDISGKAIGGALKDVEYVIWAPDGQNYYVQFYDQRGQLYNNAGIAIGDVDEGIKSISWAPNGMSYFAVFYDTVAGQYVAKQYDVIDLNELNFAQNLIIQAIFNEFKSSKQSVYLDQSLRLLLPLQIDKELERRGILMRSPASILNKVMPHMAAMWEILRKHDAGPGLKFKNEYNTGLEESSNIYEARHLIILGIREKLKKAEIDASSISDEKLWKAFLGAAFNEPEDILSKLDIEKGQIEVVRQIASIPLLELVNSKRLPGMDPISYLPLSDRREIFGKFKDYIKFLKENYDINIELPDLDIKTLLPKAVEKVDVSKLADFLENKANDTNYYWPVIKMYIDDYYNVGNLREREYSPVNYEALAQYINEYNKWLNDRYFINKGLISTEAVAEGSKIGDTEYYDLMRARDFINEYYDLHNLIEKKLSLRMLEKSAIKSPTMAAILKRQAKG